MTLDDDGIRGSEPLRDLAAACLVPLVSMTDTAAPGWTATLWRLVLLSVAAAWVVVGGGPGTPTEDGVFVSLFDLSTAFDTIDSCLFDDGVTRLSTERR